VARLVTLGGRITFTSSFCSWSSFTTHRCLLMLGPVAGGESPYSSSSFVWPSRRVHQPDCPQWMRPCNSLLLP
jgi:hypothetical protein